MTEERITIVKIYNKYGELKNLQISEHFVTLSFIAAMFQLNVQYEVVLITNNRPGLFKIFN